MKKVKRDKFTEADKDAFFDQKKTSIRRNGISSRRKLFISVSWQGYFENKGDSERVFRPHWISVHEEDQNPDPEHPMDGRESVTISAENLQDIVDLARANGIHIK